MILYEEVIVLAVMIGLFVGCLGFVLDVFLGGFLGFAIHVGKEWCDVFGKPKRFW